MKRPFLRSIGMFLTVFLLLGSSGAVYGAEEITLSGTIVDNACASGHKADMGDFVKHHTKACALEPACALSGYSIYSDGKLYEFDAASNTMIAQFLKKESSRLEVTITAQVTQDMLHLVTIADLQ